ncbi:hypothetical protein [Bacillus sp. B15-48]|uniref:hypothetical protein n=1 Tax=Bacillus sp. B15-48 TaxID=1548601 RepID=UPI00193F1352|nr:hypothetical protein [Bacillus sp. B15-48]MBM4761875.1 hypothetical protein [Bacillus sp. B15-48]
MKKQDKVEHAIHVDSESKGGFIASLETLSNDLLQLVVGDDEKKVDIDEET